MRTLRKLILGETWTLPVGIALAVGVAALLDAAAGSAAWWHDAGGFILLALLALAFVAALRFRR
jgi:membrane protein implicated in regulation of membrane protease activity